jgi:anthranilate/para-aminobenzoate synthase component I
MKISDLDRLESFALLGPRFGGSPFLLLADLRETSDDPTLIYAPFECSGADARRYAAATRGWIALEFDTPPRSIGASLRDDGYREAIGKIREAIASGDVYQVCYSVRADLVVESGADLLSAICSSDVPRFTAWVRLPGGEEFVSASPELFFETAGGRIHAEPMKGTARRAAAASLELSEKDRSELAMITDLLRNDLAPICRPRSVRVESERRLIGLPYALQAVSDVAGELAGGVTPLDALAALHPGGSVTGAPKEAALRMIRSLEPGPREAYCGALGLLDDDRSTFSLLIRTAVRTARGWVYGVGGGIVYESDADSEHEEVRIKLGALLRDAADATDPEAAAPVDGAALRQC